MSNKLTIEMLRQAKEKMDSAEIPLALFVSKDTIGDCLTHGLAYIRDGKAYIVMGIREVLLIEKKPLSEEPST